MMHTTSKASGCIRPLLFCVRFIQWVSALIVMGIVSWFINKYEVGEHLKYEEVIACTSVVFFFPGMVFAFVKTVTWQLIPLDLIFSYLWLTAFIFAAQDYSWHAQSNIPDASYKYSVEAFAFLAFFFTLCSAVLQGHVWLIEREPAAGLPIHEKPRPSADTGLTV